MLLVVEKMENAGHGVMDNQAELLTFGLRMANGVILPRKDFARVEMIVMLKTRALTVTVMTTVDSSIKDWLFNNF